MIRPAPILNLAAIAISILLTSARSASAVLIAQDLFVGGDGKITLDTESNLQWLDLTETEGLSVSQILGGQASENWVSMGWRYATFSEVCDLLESIAGPSCAPPAGPWSYSGAAELQTFMGVTTTRAGTSGIEFLTEGFFASGSASILRVNDGITAIAVATEAGFDPDEIRPGHGSFLVKVPEASRTVLLLLSLLVRIAWSEVDASGCSRRRSRRSLS